MATVAFLAAATPGLGGCRQRHADDTSFVPVFRDGGTFFDSNGGESRVSFPEPGVKRLEVFEGGKRVLVNETRGTEFDESQDRNGDGRIDATRSIHGSGAERVDRSERDQDFDGRMDERTSLLGDGPSRRYLLEKLLADGGVEVVVDEVHGMTVE